MSEHAATNRARAEAGIQQHKISILDGPRGAVKESAVRVLCAARNPPLNSGLRTWVWSGRDRVRGHLPHMGVLPQMSKGFGVMASLDDSTFSTDRVQLMVKQSSQIPQTLEALSQQVRAIRDHEKQQVGPVECGRRSPGSVLPNHTAPSASPRADHPALCC